MKNRATAQDLSVPATGYLKNNLQINPIWNAGRQKVILGNRQIEPGVAWECPAGHQGPGRQTDYPNFYVCIVPRHHRFLPCRCSGDRFLVQDVVQQSNCSRLTGSRPEDTVYPQTVILQNDAEIELWPMTPEDAPALLQFYRSLPQDDLLYLREDVTSPASMQRWIEGIESEQSWHLLAGYEGRIIADGELERQFYGWSQHIGELRIVVDRMFRNSGLSRHMTNEILGQAVDDGLYKVMVQMTVDQLSASRMFERVGFRHEAVLKDHAKDQHGELCDLVIMSYFTRDFLDLSVGRSPSAADDPA